LQTQLTFFLDKNPDDFITLYESYKNKGKQPAAAFNLVNHQMQLRTEGFTTIVNQFINTIPRDFSSGLRTNLLYRAKKLDDQYNSQYAQVKKDHSDYTGDKQKLWAFYNLPIGTEGSLTVLQQMAKIKTPSSLLQKDFDQAKITKDQAIEYWY